MQVACQDLSDQIALATAEGAKEINITGYIDDLIQCLEKERGSISELINYMNKLTAGFQVYMEERQKEREAFGRAENTTKKGGEGGELKGVDKPNEEEAGGAVEEEEFQDAKETGSVASKTSKTQEAAGNSQLGEATNAVPKPPTGEGGQDFPAAIGHGDGE